MKEATTAETTIGSIVVFVFAVIFLVWLSGTDGCAALEADLNEAFADENSSGFDKYDIERAEDCVRKYHIAGRSGYHDDAEGEARRAASYYLDAGDEANYRKWKKLETTVKEYIKGQ